MAQVGSDQGPSVRALDLRVALLVAALLFVGTGVSLEDDFVLSVTGDGWPRLPRPDAVLMVLALPLVKGSAEEQARESAGVFLAALEKGDTGTAQELLCEQERARLDEDDVGRTYLSGEGGKVVGSAEAEVDGEPAQEVRVEWDGGSRSTLIVVRDGGPRVCGVTPAS